jgi:archaeosortase A (PGF-CTERM-specific)
VTLVGAVWTPVTTRPALSAPVAQVSVPTAVSDGLAWLSVAAFVAGAVLLWVDRERAGRTVTAAAWAVFGVFWLSVFPTFAFEMHSVVEGVASLAAVPLCLHAAVLTRAGRADLLTLSRAVAFMGLLYLPVETVPVVRRTLVETVAVQAHAVMTAFGYDPQFTVGPDFGYRNRFVFPAADGEPRYSTYIVTACTGIGSIAIFGGLVAAVRAPLRRKLAAATGAVAVIWVLNVVRNAFISVAYGQQWFQQAPLVSVTTALTGESAGYTSFFVADRVLAQGLAVVALVAITVGVLRVTPELLSTVEEALYVATRREVDLGDALGVTPPDRRDAVADGGSRPPAGTPDGDRPSTDDSGDGGRR